MNQNAVFGEEEAVPNIRSFCNDDKQEVGTVTKKCWIIFTKASSQMGFHSSTGKKSFSCKWKDP
jgi:hypothetical protein